MADPEFAMVEAIAHGDLKAFESLVKRYQSRLFNFIYRYVGDHGAAEDLTQEVFLRVYQAAPRFEARAQVSSWIFKIAYNLSVNEVRRRSRIVNLDVSCGGKTPPWETPIDSIASHELVEEIMSALAELPDNQRAALLLRVNEGLSYREIAEVLELSTPSVESLIFRARRHLKQILGKMDKE